MGTALDTYATLSRQGLPQDAIAAQIRHALEDLSPKAEELQARGVSATAYNDGRRAALENAALTGEIKFAARMEVLDEMTCDPCWGLDGSVTEVGSPEFVSNNPPAHCDGGKKCRGVMVGLGPAVAGRVS